MDRDHKRWVRVTRSVLGGLAASLVLAMQVLAVGNAEVPPDGLKHPITIDATQLYPPTWWYVPGVTSVIWSLDPSSTEAFATTEPRQLALKPGAYRFGTFTFDFPFQVTSAGVLDFARSLDQCIAGRGTQTLIVRCSQTQPYARQPDY